MRLTSDTFESSTDYKAHLIVFLAAIGARIFYFIFVNDPAFFFKYPFFADKLLNGKDIGERLVDLSPFYLYFLTYLKKIFGVSWTSVKFIQSGVGVLNAILIFAIGSRAFRKEAGCLAGLIYAVYGNVLILEATLEPEVFVLLFNLLTVYFFLLAREYDLPFPLFNKLLLPAAGLFAGFTIITKPNFLLFLPLAVIWILFDRAGTLSLKTRLAQILLFLVSALMVVMPVTVRNYVKLHDFVLVTADAGKVFFHGSSKGASALEGIGLMDEGFAEDNADEPDYAHALFRKTASRLSARTLSPSESSRFWMKRTLKDIAEEPGAFLKRELEKLLLFFSDYEMHDVASAYKEYKTSLSFPFIRYGVIAPLGLLGLILSLKRFKELFLIYGVVLVYLLSGLLIQVQARYRTPAIPYLCLFAGFAVYFLKERIIAKKFASLSLSLFLVAVFFFSGLFLFRSEINSMERWQAATKIHYQMGARPLFEKGRYQEAIAELNQCLALEPDFAPAYNLKGKAEAISGMYQTAETDFQKVISLSPNMPDGYKNLGFLYLLQGKVDLAREFLGRALSLAPHDQKVQSALLKLKR